MRLFRAAPFVLLLASGCMQLPRPYPYSGQPFTDAERRTVEAKQGETGALPTPFPAPAAEAPAPSKKAVGGESVPTTPRTGPSAAKNLRPKKIRPKIHASLRLWVAQVLGGSMKSVPGFSKDTVGLMEDLSVKRETGITLLGDIDIHKGPRIWFAYSSFQPYTHDANVNLQTDISLSILELGFTPVRGHYKWGVLELDAGVRYAKWRIEFDWSNRFPSPDIHYSETVEGLMGTVGGGGKLRLMKDLLALDAKLAVGVGPDSGFGVFDTGVTVWPNRPFHARLGARIEALYLFDGRRSGSERRVHLSHHGVFLEMGFTF